MERSAGKSGLAGKGWRWWVVLFAAWLVVAFLAGVGQLAQRTRLKPVHETNMPDWYLVVGRDRASERYLLLALEAYSRRIQEACASYSDREEVKDACRGQWLDWEVLWKEDEGKYEYCLAEDRLPAILEEVNLAFSGTWRSVHIAVAPCRDDDKAQLVTLVYATENIYRHTYKALPGSVVPVAYGDLTRADGLVVMLTAGAVFLAGLLATIRVANARRARAKRVESGREE